MTRYQIDSAKMIAWLLPPLKRLPVRIAWLNALLKKIRNIHDEFISTGTSLKVAARLNGQTINIENYLIDRFGAGIVIVNHTLNFQAMSIGDGNDIDSYIGATESESSSIGAIAVGVNFTVQVPGAIVYDQSELKAIINKFKIPGSTYTIEAI